ncbi:MAG: oxidoreductase [Candidatus Acidoferrum typicum]|nr:oxidoreductase [Candidatus Acidoferrum typicum]
MKLKDKISIVTGAAQGIGRGIADRFVKEGAFVAVSDYKEPRTKLLSGQQFFQGDVSDPALWIRITSRLLEEHGQIHVLVNNAAIIQHARVHEVQLEDWNRALAVNLTSVMLGMRAVIPGMLTNGGGSIINLSSIWGSVAAPGAASYHATKAGVAHLTKNAAVTYAKNNIRVNAIHPGAIHTPMMEEMPKDTLAWVISQTPEGRTGNPRISPLALSISQATRQRSSLARSCGSTVATPRSEHQHWTKRESWECYASRLLRRSPNKGGRLKADSCIRGFWN